MLNGATDGAYLRGKGVQSFGIGSINEGRLHGNDERIRVDEVRRGPRVLYDVVTALAEAK